MFKKLRVNICSKSVLKAVLFFLTFFIVGAALAQASGGGGGGGVGKIADTVTGSFKSLAQLFLAIAYIAGIAFAIAAIFKFKQHKDNPTQIPLGTPIALLVIAISLIFVGYFIKPLGQTLGAEESAAGGPTGTAKGIPGLEK